MRFVVKEYEVSLVGKHSERTIAIGIEDEFGMVFPSPLTNFIKSEYYTEGKSLSSQKNVAYAITRFFNYVYKNISMPFYTSLKVKGLKGIKLEHAAAYITELSLQTRAKIKSSDYVKTDLDYINSFFHWLKKQEKVNIVNTINQKN